MRLVITLSDKARLDNQHHEPGQEKQTVDDEFGIAVALLPHIEKKIVGESDHTQQQHCRAAPEEMVFAPGAVLFRAPLPAWQGLGGGDGLHGH